MKGKWQLLSDDFDVYSEDNTSKYFTPALKSPINLSFSLNPALRETH
jgi:hypothetical protein